MAKIALLIGVSKYEPGLTPLPAATKDVEAMQQVLENPDIGGFDEVKVLVNPPRQEMEEAIEMLFDDRQKDDLLLLFFSGHGIKDEEGNLYFATHNTRKNLLQSTTVSAKVVHQVMKNSRSKREVVILDCCFSGAFAEGLLARNDVSVDIKSQLGGEGRAVLTSSTSTQYSFEQQGADTSIYTRYIVEGLETGAADRDEDGWISVDELHEYATKAVQEATPAMKPEIYAIKEGYKINVAKAPIDDPYLIYRREVEYWVKRGNGEISDSGREVLDELKRKPGLTSKETEAIEDQVLEPHREYQRKWKRYKERFIIEIQRQYPISDDTRADLKRFQKILGFTDENIALIEAPIIAKQSLIESKGVVDPLPGLIKVKYFIGACIIGVMGILSSGTLGYVIGRSVVPTPEESCEKETYTLNDRISLGEKILLTQDKNPDKEAGVKAFLDGDCKTAIEKFESYRKAKPTDPEALIYLNNAKARENGNRLKIAVSVPIGTNPYVAKEMLRGVAQAQDEVNNNNSGINGKALEVAIANDDNDRSTGRNIAKAFVTDKNVLAVVGHQSSDVTEEAGKEYNSGELVAISPTSTSMIISNFSRYVFRTVPNDKLAAEKLAEYMVTNLQNKKAAVFYHFGHAYSESLKEEFAKAVKDKYGEVLETFDLSKLNFNANTAVKKAISQNIEVLMLIPNSITMDKVHEVVKEVKNNQKQLNLLGGEVLDRPYVLEHGKQFEGMVVATPWIDSNPKSNFVKNSKTLWEAPVSWRMATSYDATQAIIGALKINNTRNGIQKTLHSSSFSVDGATGKIQFSQSGDRINNSIFLIKVQQKPGTDKYEFVPIP
ncbi:MAG: ABC transporter substrate-binding protein [Anabaena sp. MDT14b]|jgi:branched-chain amino acid transport system substrate-binding protein|nr:MAG: ABC transporter substrate-binding protein [Anabaena sp. MDT14b]